MTVSDDIKDANNLLLPVEESETPKPDPEELGAPADDNEETQGSEKESDDEEKEDASTPSIDDIRKNVREHDERMKDDREEFAFYETRIQSVQNDLLKGLPDFGQNEGKTIYEMSADEFQDVIILTFRTQDQETAERLVTEAKAARKEYFTRMAPYIEESSKLAEEAEAFRKKEWEIAEKELKALYPGIEKHAKAIQERALKDLKASPLTVDRVNLGVSAKFKFLVALVKSMGIENILNDEESKKEQGNREAALSGKGKSSSGSKARETGYTPQGIRNMSMDEYRAQKDKIYAHARRTKK